MQLRKLHQATQTAGLHANNVFTPVGRWGYVVRVVVCVVVVPFSPSAWSISVVVVHSVDVATAPSVVLIAWLVRVSVVSDDAAAVSVTVSVCVVSDFPVDVVMEDSIKEVLVSRLELVCVSVCVLEAVDVFVALCSCA